MSPPRGGEVGDTSAMGGPPTLRHQNRPRWPPGDFKVCKQTHVVAMAAVARLAGELDDKAMDQHRSPSGINFIFNPWGFGGLGGGHSDRDRENAWKQPAPRDASTRG